MTAQTGQVVAAISDECDAPTIFPKRPYKISTVIIFCVFMFFVVATFWAFFKKVS